MRRSQAPSFRCTPNPVVNNTNSGRQPNDEASPEIRRGTDAILSLLLGNNAVSNSDNVCVKTSNEDETVVLEKDQKPENSVDSSPQKYPGRKIYNVVYGKPSKRKHKVWEGDGTVEVGTKVVTLKDEKGRILGTTSQNKSKDIEVGSHLFIGSKEVEVIELISENSEAGEGHSSPVKPVVKKLKLNPSGKGFVSPSLLSLDKSENAFILPEPNAEHQWHFNKDGLPVSPVYVEGFLAKNLRRHQCIGITFLYECIMGFRSSDVNGAILADEMGLGKTLQTIVLVWTLLKQGPYGNKPVLKKVLIVTPSSLTMNWHNEFIKWLGRIRMVPYVIDSKNKPQNMRSPVMIVSYEMFVRYYEDIKDIAFDLLVCDEGHRLKNSNIRAAQLLRSLNCPKRILLTGTPIQNDLKEFYTLIDFVNPNILGTPVDFRVCFEGPILASRQPMADEEVVLKGEECAADLNRKTSVFLLRRTKEVLKDYLPTKNEVVVFCKAAPIQREIYNYMINVLRDSSEKILGYVEGFLHLGLIMSLRKVCNHPALLWTKDPEEIKEDILLSKTANSFDSVRNNFDSHMSAKLTVVLNFLVELKRNFPKERVVLISISTQTLDLLDSYRFSDQPQWKTSLAKLIPTMFSSSSDLPKFFFAILEKKIKELGYSSCRLDGSTPASQRASTVEKFNLSCSSIFVFLLSSKAGGVGLNLTGASRLILYDSDWNPATDLQAMSRIWRDGQKTSVYIYRLLTAGTIEEKIYQRQINKQGLYEGVMDAQKTKSIKLSQEELKDIFAYCDTGDGCSTHEILSCRCNKNGDIPSTEEEERSCQLIKQSKSLLKMNELFHWEHHGSPINPSLLSELCLSNSEECISFIFRSSKI